ncbi:hypothetical protein HQ560_11155 [bacterium]|nr:hypothetical protein [bacterium]
MSDRCLVSITLRREDLPKLLGMLGYTDQEIRRGSCGIELAESDDGSATVRVHEANYPGSSRSLVSSQSLDHPNVDPVADQSV